MSFHAYFDGPHNYKHPLDFYEQGGSPLLLKRFIDTIDAQKQDIVEINVSWYLYNNRLLHNYLKTLSKTGIVVNIVTIPLEGYDHSKPQLLKDLDTEKQRKESVTKYDLAREIFAEMYKSEDHPNLNLFFFSTFVREERLRQQVFTRLITLLTSCKISLY